jgi:putative oxidoreductase
MMSGLIDNSKKRNAPVFLKSKMLQIACQLLLGGVFIYASLGKVLDQQGFISAIHSYRILPDLMVRPISYILPFVELIFGILLTVGVMTRLSATVLSVLLAIFIIAICSALIRGINIDCGCFLQITNDMQDSSDVHDGLYIAFRDALLFTCGLVIVLGTNKGMIKRRVIQRMQREKHSRV